MKEIGLDEKKEILLEMLVEIDSFCRDHNIQYFLTGGTLLGAIRHQGFIPWDDDIDIAMLRNDYETFSSLFNKHQKGNLKWIDLNNTKDYYLPFGKVIDTRTSLFEEVVHSIELGIFIDVFPIDNVGNDKGLAAKRIKKKLLAERIVPIKELHISLKRNPIKNIIIALCKLYPCDAFDLAKIRDIKYKKIATFAGKESRYVANLYGAWGTKEIVEKKVFEKPIDHVFENKIFSIPVGYDDLLRSLYGNYMELPPVEKRVSHHENIAYWKK